eukprot:5765114-Pleurochrysis_carterae.AAC.1
MLRTASALYAADCFNSMQYITLNAMLRVALALCSTLRQAYLASRPVNAMQWSALLLHSVAHECNASERIDQ